MRVPCVGACEMRVLRGLGACVACRDVQHGERKIFANAWAKGLSMLVLQQVRYLPFVSYRRSVATGVRSARGGSGC